MFIDLAFLVLGIGLTMWSVIAIVNPDLSWMLNVRGSAILGTQSPGERPPNWAARSRRLGIYALVIGVFNIVLSAVRLV